MARHSVSARKFSRMLRRLLARAAEDEAAAAGVEFGLVIPMLGLMVVSASDIGMAVYRKMQVENAAQAGAQYAMLHNNPFDATAISTAVASATKSSNITASPAPATFCGCATTSSITTVACGTTCPTGALAGTYTTVSAQATFSTLMNYSIVPNNYTFTAQSTVRLQ